MAELVFVGTGDAFGSGGRRNSAILLRHAGRNVLLDCGPMTLLGLKQLAIDPLDIDAVAISHFHGDHFAGLPFLMLEYQYSSPRDRPLHVMGPPGIEERVWQMAQTFEYHGVREHGYDVRFSEFQLGCDVVGEDYRIRAQPAYHHPETKPHMLRVGIGGREVFFTGDTGWFDTLPDEVGAPDLLVAECVFMEPTFDFHLNHQKLEQTKQRFSAERTILTHLGIEVIENRDQVRFETADDGMRIEL